jgi:hypothetical protein
MKKFLLVLTSGVLFVNVLSSQNLTNYGASSGTSGNNSTYFGTYAGRISYAFGNSFLGSSSGYANTSGTCNAFTGTYSGYFNTIGSYNTFSGYGSGAANVGGSNNSFTGYNSGGLNLNGSYNVFNGSNAGEHNSSGSYNCFIGSESGRYNTTGSGNVFSGDASGFRNVYGSNNVFSGRLSGYNNYSGSANVFSGYNSGYYNSNGNYNVYIGNFSGYYNNNSNNVSIGGSSGYTLTSYSASTFIGYEAIASSPALVYNSAAIGYQAVVDKSNSMVFGNSGVTSWGFGVNVDPWIALQVGTNPGNGNTAYLTSGGTWSNVSNRELKEDISELDGKTILNKINNLEITRWKYKGTENEYHIGPMAQDFYKAFNVGLDDQHISTVDPSGVALLGIQELSRQRVKDSLTIKNLEAENLELNKRMDQFESMLLQLSTDLQSCCLASQNQPAETDARHEMNITGPALEQNIPNPFSYTTTIRYYIPYSIKTCQLQVLDATGKVVFIAEISDRGTSSTELQLAGFANGTYFYSLMVDGQIFDTKKMVVSK